MAAALGRTLAVWCAADRSGERHASRPARGVDANHAAIARAVCAGRTAGQGEPSRMHLERGARGVDPTGVNDPRGRAIRIGGMDVVPSAGLRNPRDASARSGPTPAGLPERATSVSRGSVCVKPAGAAQLIFGSRGVCLGVCVKRAGAAQLIFRAARVSACLVRPNAGLRRRNGRLAPGMRLRNLVI